MGELSAAGLKAKLSGLSKTPPAKPVRIGAGGGLHLLVKPAQRPGSGAWVLRFVLKGKRRDMGLGAYPTVSLAEARLAALEARKAAARGADPIAAKAAARARLSNEANATFEAVAEKCFEARATAWKNPKHANQWIASIRAFVVPFIGRKAVTDIVAEDLRRVLEPIWTTIPETASRVRGRIENVLNFAVASGLRPPGPNPAAWRGNLSELLGAPSRLKAAARARKGRAENHASLPFADVPVFLNALEQKTGLAALALRFAILTAVRTGEVRAMRWNEVDLEKSTWIIPAERMKGGKSHIVPLSSAARNILDQVKPLQSESGLVFPSRSNAALSDMALSMLVRGMMSVGTERSGTPLWTDEEGRPIVPHGFRASFKAWSLAKGWPDYLSEKALAHADRNKARAAYARDHLVEERRPMMEAWAAACTIGNSKKDG